MSSKPLVAATMLALITLPLGGCSLYLACGPKDQDRVTKEHPERPLPPVHRLKVYRDYLLVSANGEFALNRWEDPWRSCAIYDREPTGDEPLPLSWLQARKLRRSGYVEPAKVAPPEARKLAPGVYAWNEPSQTLFLFEPVAAGKADPSLDGAGSQAVAIQENGPSRHVEVNMTMPRYEVETRSQDFDLSRVAKGGSPTAVTGQPGGTASCPPVTIQFPSTFPALEIQTSKGLEALLTEVAQKLSTGFKLQEVPVKVHGGADQRIELEGSVHGVPEAGHPSDALEEVAEDKLSRPDEPLKLLFADGRYGEDQCVESLRLGFEGDLAQLSQVELRPLASCPSSSGAGSALMVQVQDASDVPDGKELPLVILQQVDSNVLEGNVRGRATGTGVQCFLLTGTEESKGRLLVKTEDKDVTLTETRRSTGPQAAGGIRTTERKEQSQKSETTTTYEKSKKLRARQTSLIRVVKVCGAGGS